MTERIIPYNERGNPLSPIEARTGVVLPILSLPSQEEGQKRNRHHAHFYAEDFENGTLAQRAVRFSRLQSTSRGKHKRYHSIFDGTRFPESPQEEMTVTVLNYAEYVPDLAVDLSGSSYEIKELKPAEKAELQRAGTFTIEKSRKLRAEIGQFLMGCAIWQDIPGHANRSLVDEFLSITPEQSQKDENKRARKLHIAKRLIHKGIGLAVDPINAEFNKARKRRAIPVGKPVCAWLVVKQYVDGYEADYVDTLDYRIRAEHAQAA